MELLCSYLEEQLPLTELQNDGTGAYLVAVMTDEKRVGSIPLQPVTFSTQDRSLKSAQSIVMQDSGAAGTIVVNKTKDVYKRQLIINSVDRIYICSFRNPAF